MKRAEQSEYCPRCEGDGSVSELAPCTTGGSDCACNGPRVLIDPCPDCGGTGQRVTPLARSATNPSVTT